MVDFDKVNEEGKVTCQYCLETFKNISRHKCKVKALTDEADAIIASGEPMIKKGKVSELIVNESSTKGIKPDAFWAWTEGLGYQIRTLIDTLGEIKNAMIPILGVMEEIRNYMGNSSKVSRETMVNTQEIALNTKKMNINLAAVATSFADAFEILQNGKIVDEDRVKELKEKKEFNGFKKVVSKPKTQEEADAEAYEELAKEVFNSDEVVSYKDNPDLPEHTRKLKGVIEIITPKALMIQFANGKEAWIPKSTVHEGHKEEKELNQDFIIDSWVLLKNGIIEEEGEE